MLRFLAILALLSLCGCALYRKPITPAAAPGVVTAATPTSGSISPAQKKPSPLNPLNWPKLLFPKKKEPPKALPPSRIGSIAFIDEENGFVLIDAESLSGAVPGESLTCVSNQTETGTVRLSALRNPPFLVADVIGGKPGKGDVVYKR